MVATLIAEALFKQLLIRIVVQRVEYSRQRSIYSNLFQYFFFQFTMVPTLVEIF